MYSVYINHFKRGNSVVDTEELMFTVPDASASFPLTKPVVKSNEDSADNFSFSMESSSPYYDSILPLKTMFRVEYDGDIIFFGRALAPSTSTVFHTKSVTCEGKFVFLNDTYYEGKQDKYRDNITLSAYYDALFTNHNTMAPTKAFTKGTVGVTLPSKTDKFEPSSWTQSSSLFSNMTSNYGGHMKARYTSGDTTYIDWYKYYVRDLGDNLRPKVTIGKNILDISSDISLDDIFSRVIPMGSSDRSGQTIYLDGYVYTDKGGSSHTFSGKVFPVSMIRDLYTDQQLTDEFHDYRDYRDVETNYGVIYKPMSFGDCDTQAKLFNEVKEWVKNAYFGVASSFSVKAIDMHITDGSMPKILLGDCVDVTYYIVVNGTPQWQTKKLVCKAVSYDLFNPENNSYTFGVPSDLLTANKDRKKSSKKTSSAATSNNKPTPKGDGDPEWTWYKIFRMISSRSDRDAGYDPDYEGATAGLSFYGNGELSGTVTCYDPNEVVNGNGTPVGSNPLNHKDHWFSARLVGKITLNGKTTKWVALAEDRGIFAYYNGVGGAFRIAHWYTKEKGTYQITGSGSSSFETIATLIEKDTNQSWGGSTAATSFRNNGKISGSINKAYDPDKCTQQQAAADPSLVFSADIVGKFTLNAATKYVAISKEFGIFGFFGFNSSARGIIPATHWYMRVKGASYDNVAGLIAEANTGNVYATSTGDPEEKKTVFIKTQELTGQGSQGEIFVGYDLTGQTDSWKVKLNIPIRYTDENGQTVTADGFVSASDFNLQSIPSFKTKMVVTDVLIAGKVNAVDIEADLAYIRKINSDSISSNTYVSSYHMRCNDISANSYSLNIPGSGGSSSDVAYLENSFSNCLVWAGTGTGGSNNELGKIYFQFSKIGGGVAQTVNFNIADTQFYMDAVSAAWNNGGATAYFTASITSDLDPGQTSTLYAYYTNNSGNATRSAVTGAGHYSELTIKARNLRLRTPAAAVRPTTSNQTIYPGSDSGGVAYDGLAQVVVEGDEDLVAGNIKDGVTIFGVIGTYSGGSGTTYYDRGEWTLNQKTISGSTGYAEAYFKRVWTSGNFPSWISGKSVGSNVRFYTTS